MTSLSEARLSQQNRSSVGLLSDTARSSGGGPLRLMAAALLATGIIAGISLTVGGRLTAAAGSMIGTAEALLGHDDATLAALPRATPSLAGPLSLMALSPAELMQQYPPAAGQSLIEGSFTRPAWQRFQRPAAPASQPQLAILVTGLGLNKALTAAAILYLPPDISLSFSPYAPDLAAWIATARAHGHEILVDLPMESAAPQDDPGSDGLRTGLKPSENSARLARILERTPQVVGVATSLGSRFLTDRSVLSPVLADLADRGLGIIEASPDPRLLVGELGTAARQPRAKATLAIDEAKGRDDILRDLTSTADGLRGTSQNTGQNTGQNTAPALIVVAPSPLSLALIASWCQQLPRQGLAPVPASNMRRQ